MKSQLFRYRGVTLAMTFIVYTVYHMSRRPLSIVKGTLARDCHNETITNHTDYSCNEPPFNHSNAIQLMGVLDSCFLFTYAICMFFSGYLAERSNLRYFLAAALACCGLNCILFGLAHPFKIQALWYFIIIQILSGITQTTGWPAVVAVVGNWFGSAKKGLIFGIWNWHTSVGNILGALIAGKFKETITLFHCCMMNFIVSRTFCRRQLGAFVYRARNYLHRSWCAGLFLPSSR